jgi:hypothetical protein
VFKHTAVSCGLERSAGSLADLVQLVLQGIDLPFQFLEGSVFRGDEQSSILAPGVAQEGNSDGCRAVRGPRPDVQLKGSEYMHGCVSHKEKSYGDDYRSVG